ncbi:MAG TPA: BON domain-containing protein [Casimicrobiaceae bacterium]
MSVGRLASVGSFVLAAALLATATASLTGCVPLVVAGVGAGVMVATDRRSSGAQVDDETIELKIAKAMTDRWGSRDVHLNATSYNGVVLLTGEVPSTVVQDEIVQFVKSTDRVRIVENDTTIGPVADFQSRTNDTYITSKVKARMVEAAKFAPNHVKVVTERSVVYLMGIVSRREGTDAAEIAATTSGVARVVKVFEYTN